MRQYMLLMIELVRERELERDREMDYINYVDKCCELVQMFLFLAKLNHVLMYPSCTNILKLRNVSSRTIEMTVDSYL